MNITLSIPITPKQPNHEIAKVLRDLANVFEPGSITSGAINKLADNKELPALPTDAPIEYTFDQITNQFKDYASQYGRESAVKILNTFKVKKVADLKPETYAKVMKALGA